MSAKDVPIEAKAAPSAGALRAASKLRALYGQVIMEAPEYVASIEEGAEIIDRETAAPELLAALETFVVIRSSTVTDENRIAAYEKAEAAIRKAKGRELPLSSHAPQMSAKGASVEAKMGQHAPELFALLKGILDFRPAIHIAGSQTNQGNFRNWLTSAERLIAKVSSHAPQGDCNCRGREKGTVRKVTTRTPRAAPTY